MKYSIPFLALLLLAGCTPDKVVVNAPVDPTQDRLLAVMRAYSGYLDTQSKPPQSEADIRPLLEKEGKPDELLTSGRDGQKFVIVWGIDLRQPLPWVKGIGVIGYEAKGDGQTRFVLTTFRNAQEMTAEQFAAASFPPGHMPPK
jgi:hypothetical protein